MTTKLDPKKKSWERHAFIITSSNIESVPRLYKFVETYAEAIEKAQIYASSLRPPNTRSNEVRLNPAEAPEQLLTRLKKELDGNSTNVTHEEITVPFKPRLNLLGITVDVPVYLIAKYGFFLNSIAFIMWLGSLHITRRREILGIRRSGFRQSTYPHLLNGTRHILVYSSFKNQARKTQVQKTHKKFFLVLMRVGFLFFLCLVTVFPTLRAALFAQPWHVFSNPGVESLAQLGVIDKSVLGFGAFIMNNNFPYLVCATACGIQFLNYFFEELLFAIETPIDAVVVGRDVESFL